MSAGSAQPVDRSVDMPDPVGAGDRRQCARIDCHLPAAVSLVGTAGRGEMVLAKIPATKPLPILLMEPVDLCRGHAIETLAHTLQLWES